MKAYGIPRNIDLNHPDITTIKEFGLKSSTGHNTGKSGDCKSYFRKAEAKAATRRLWKKKERNAQKNALRFEV